MAHLALGVALWPGIVERADTLAERAVGDALGGGAESAQGGEKGHSARVAPAEGRGALAAGHRRQRDALDRSRGDGTRRRPAAEGHRAVTDAAAQRPQAR